MKFADAGFPVPGREFGVEMKRRFPISRPGMGVNFRRTPSSYGPHFEPQISQISQIDLWLVSFPRAMPWAIVCRPFGAEELRDFF